LTQKEDQISSLTQILKDHDPEAFTDEELVQVMIDYEKANSIKNVLVESQVPDFFGAIMRDVL